MHLSLAWMPALLAKELIELAQLKRTYILRVVYALALLILLVAAAPELFVQDGSGQKALLGIGGHLFSYFEQGSLWAVYLFLPLLVAPLVPDEEERGNLDILMVSGIGPWEFIVEKLLSRLVGMGSLLLIGLPFSAFAYAMGGVNAVQIVTAAVSILAACLQVGCWSMWCSSTSHTSMRAIGMAYFQGYLWLFAVTPLLVALLSGVSGVVLRLLGIGADEALWSYSYSNPFTLISASASATFTVAQAVIGCYPMLLSAGIALIMAVRGMRRRGSSPSPTMREQLRLYRPGSMVERRRRQRIIALGADTLAMPGDQPLAWRELRRIRFYSWFGKLQWGWLGILLALWETGVFIHARSRMAWNVDHVDYLDAFSCVVLLAAVAITSITASGLIAGERSRGSLEILLVLPLSTRELITQKMAICNRVIKGSVVLLCVLSTGETLAEMSRGLPGTAILHFSLAMLLACIHLQLAAWLSLAVSLHVRAQVRAAITALSAIILWCIVPFVLLDLAMKSGLIDGKASYWSWCELASPLNVYDTQLRANHAWLWEVLANVGVYLVLMLAMRAYCLRRATALLGRLG